MSPDSRRIRSQISKLTATFRHIYGVLEKLEPNPEVQTVVLSVGVNNRKQKTLTAVKELQRLYKIAQEKFLNAAILIPLINILRDLAEEEQIVLREINDYVKTKYPYLKKLPADEFHTERDAIHWTQETAAHLLRYWIAQESGRSP